jgi:hypothetical protein
MGIVTFHGFCGAPEVFRRLRVLVEQIADIWGVEMQIEAPPSSPFGAR